MRKKEKQKLQNRDVKPNEIKRIFSCLDVFIASGQHTQSAKSLCIICNSFSIKPKPFCGLYCSTGVDRDRKIQTLCATPLEYQDLHHSQRP